MTDMVSELERDVTMNKKVKVKVTASPLTTDPWVSFAMKADYLDQGGKQDGEKLKFNARAGEFDLTFDLDDKTDLELAFYPTPADAMWVAVGTTDPNQPGFANGAITPVSVTDKKLIVINANLIPETLTFILRFSGTASSGGYPPYVYDPEIVNGGGKNLEHEEQGEDCE